MEQKKKRIYQGSHRPEHSEKQKKQKISSYTHTDTMEHNTVTLNGVNGYWGSADFSVPFIIIKQIPTFSLS